MASSLISEVLTYREAAELLGLPGSNGYRVISALVEKWELQPKRSPIGNAKALDRRDLEVLATALNETLDGGNRRAS